MSLKNVTNIISILTLIGGFSFPLKATSELTEQDSLTFLRTLSSKERFQLYKEVDDLPQCEELYQKVKKVSEDFQYMEKLKSAEITEAFNEAKKSKEDMESCIIYLKTRKIIDCVTQERIIKAARGAVQAFTALEQEHHKSDTIKGRYGDLINKFGNLVSLYVPSEELIQFKEQTLLAINALLLAAGKDPNLYQDPKFLRAILGELASAEEEFEKLNNSPLKKRDSTPIHSPRVESPRSLPTENISSKPATVKPESTSPKLESSSLETPMSSPKTKNRSTTLGLTSSKKASDHIMGYSEELQKEFFKEHTKIVGRDRSLSASPSDKKEQKK